MYICEKHGTLESEWCDQCNDVVKCDRSDQETWRFKDLMYDYKNGTRTITIRATYCDTCGKLSGIKHD